jgi:hypothetical protein
MTTPQTLARPELEPCDIERWTAILVDRPAVALINTRRDLGILLAKDVAEVHPPRTLLCGVRWVRLPIGWRGAALRVLSKWNAARLPAEFLFEAVSLEDRPRDDMRDGLAYVANISPDCLPGMLLPHPSPHRYPVKFLTHRQYNALSCATGRDLTARIRETFADEFRAERRRSIGSMIPLLNRPPQLKIGPVFAG